jgi:hypothetical protein
MIRGGPLAFQRSIRIRIRDSARSPQSVDAARLRHAVAAPLSRAAYPASPTLPCAGVESRDARVVVVVVVQEQR